MIDYVVLCIDKMLYIHFFFVYISVRHIRIVYRIVFPSYWHACLVPGYKQPYLKVCYRNAIQYFDLLAISRI